MCQNMGDDDTKALFSERHNILARTHWLQQTRGGSDALLPWRFMTSSNAAAIENAVTALRYRRSISYDHDCIKLTSRWSRPSADGPLSRTHWL